MKIKTKIALVTTLSLGLAGLASADTLSETCSIGPSTLDFTASAISCAQFGIAGATLNSISITLSGADTGAISLTNNNATDDTIATGTISTFYSLDSALNGFAFSTPLFTITMSLTAAPLLAGATASNGALSGANTTGALLNSNAGTFGTYTGAGFFDIFVDTTSSFGTSVSPANNSNNTASTESATVSASANIIFDYTPGSTAPAPEPSTLAFLALGGGLVALGARRRNKA